MAQYLAKLDENNIVIDIIKVGGTECCDEHGNIDEEKTIAYIKSIFADGHQNYALGCKYGSIRGNPIEIGGYYHNGQNVFVRKKPHPSATLNENFQWEMPPFVTADKTGLVSSDGSSLLPGEETEEEPEEE
nr:hypothetical protein 13 [Burkholderiaceae bacterium]